MNNNIWFKDFKNFFNKDNLLVFFPSTNMNVYDQLNSIFKLSLYFSFIMILISNNYRYIYFALFTAFFTIVCYFIFNNDLIRKNKILQRNNFSLSKQDTFCTKPTKNNPFMNYLQNEIKDNPNKAPACDISNKKIKKDILNNFNIGLNRNVDDIFLNQASDRQFYTNPSTGIINDQEGFGKFLYNLPKTCKEDGVSCYKNISRYPLA
jgi:hypothetical protein